MDIPTQAHNSVANFSDCQHYRWDLIRDFSQGHGTLNFIMLNPSTANEMFNDPTVARCENRTLNMGFNRMIVTNIFAFRATDPDIMRSQHDPVGIHNDEAITRHANDADMIICAWGNHGQFLNRGRHVKRLLDQLNCPLHYLKMNGCGEPAHPLYLRKNLEPVRWM